jgi:hypothetical protein
MNRALRTFGVLTAGLLLVSGLAHAPAVAGEPTTDPTVPTLAVGECFDLTTADTDAASVTKAPTDCTGRHTSEVIAVSALPAQLTWDSPRADILAAVEPVCGRAWDRVTGSNPLRQIRVQLGSAWFQPTTEQAGLGARWFSCHMVVWDDSGLAALPHPLAKLGKRIPDSLATCLTKGKDYTTCADKHAWRSTHSFYAAGKATRRTIDRAADRACPRHVTSRKWLRSSYQLTPKRFIVVCYSKTNR